MAGFVKVDEFSLPTFTDHHGIAFDGANWHVANSCDQSPTWQPEEIQEQPLPKQSGRIAGMIFCRIKA